MERNQIPATDLNAAEFVYDGQRGAGSQSNFWLIPVSAEIGTGVSSARAVTKTNTLDVVTRGLTTC